ncbi:MAG: LPS export ABC transporter periplasmic protein LptC [Alphaproteobacteria bacterium]|nr:LPS export ABC transporter periplasmic protein LptC [Alphaproteobacteria bacterium]
MVIQAQSSIEKDRLSDLNVADNHGAVINRGYTRFVKSMRIIIPLIALALMVVVITWPEMEDQVAVIPKETLIPQAEMGENELLNPNFETVDSQMNPVKVTAQRATQNQDDPDLVNLDKPNADLKMKDGSGLLIEADRGVYEQEAEKLFLESNVILQHESGYELQAKELRVNMQSREAFSDKDVYVTGPEAQIQATGLEGNVETGILLFKGPAQLTLTPAKEQPEEEKKAQ